MSDDNGVTDVIEQPPLPRRSSGVQLGHPIYQAGHQRAVKRLEILRFDPIQELVEKYRKLEAELERYESIRAGAIVELKADGKPRAYNYEAHYAIYDKLLSVASTLLRYNYGRVPELNVLETRQPQPLIINLTNKGDKYVVNDQLQDD